MNMNRADFSRSVEQSNPGIRIPLYGTVELTFRCNMRCVHCYSLDGQSDGDLSLFDYERIFGELVDAGCVWLQLTGGEVMLRSDFEDIYMIAKRLGLLMTVFTSGTIMRNRLLQTFTDYPPYRVEITFHSYREETFDRITQIKGSYQRCQRMIEELQHRCIPIVLKAVGMTINADDLAKTRQWCNERGIDFKFDTTLIPTLGGSLEPYRLQLSSERVAALNDLDIERAEARTNSEEKKRFKPRRFRYDACGAGQSSFNISPDGKLTICALARHMAYDLRRGSFSEGWSQFLTGVITEPPLRPGQTWQGTKVGCPAVAHIEEASLRRHRKA